MHTGDSLNNRRLTGLVNGEQKRNNGYYFN